MAKNGSKPNNESRNDNDPSSSLLRTPAAATYDSLSSSVDAHSPRKASIPNEVANIAKNLIGSGVLSLPGGIAAFSSHRMAIVSALGVLLLNGLLLGTFAWIIGIVCEHTQADTYGMAIQRSIGPKYAKLMAFIIALSAGSGDLAYATIVSQTFPSIVEYGFGIRISRIASLLFLMVFVLYPLCRLRELRRLAPFSILGVIAMFVTGIAMVVRYLDGSYQEGGTYYESIPVSHRPSFDVDGAPHLWYQQLPYISMNFQAFVMHYNAPRFYYELENPSVARFRTALLYSFGLATVLYGFMTFAGYETFGANCDSYILNNYASTDTIATLGRMSVFLSTVLIFPLAFVGFRDGISDAFSIPVSEQLTIGLLASITFVAVLVTDLGVINAVTGGLFATVIVVLVPTLMYCSIPDSENRHIVILMAVTGGLLGLAGAGVAAKKAIHGR